MRAAALLFHTFSARGQSFPGTYAVFPRYLFYFLHQPAYHRGNKNQHYAGYQRI